MPVIVGPDFVPEPFVFDMPAPKIDIDPALEMRLDDLKMHLDDLRVNVAPFIAQAGDVREQVRQQTDQARQMAEQAREVARAQGDMKMAFAFENGANAYRAGLDALQQRQYEQAIRAFDRVVTQKNERADAALYWKGFAEFKLARTDDALASIAQLRRDYAQSRYLNEAKVLEADVRKASGQPVNPANANDDEIKLLAIQGLSKSGDAVPLLEGVLNATNSLNVKKRALYVLALSDDTRAHAVLMRYAKGGGNPDLQIEAIRYLASRRDSKTTPAELRDVYDGTTDLSVRMAVIDAYRTWEDKAALLRIAGDKAASVDLRRAAVSRLPGLVDASDVMTLYQQETDPAVRGQIVGLLISLQAFDQLSTIAQKDGDQNVRLRAIRTIGNQRNDRASQALIGLYGSEQSKDVRRAVIQSLRAQNNAEALVALAKKETDLDLKREIVRNLSDMAPNSKPAADFLMEQLR